MIKIAAHQPNLLPYLGYWHKIYFSDIFVLLDDIQITTGSKDAYTHRTSLVDINGNNQWCTFKIDKSRIPISEVTYNIEKSKEALETKIDNYYKKAPYYTFWKSVIMEEFNKNNNNLSKLNINLINRIIDILPINKLKEVRLIRSSEIPYDKNLLKTDRLNSIFKTVCDNKDYLYYSGLGAKNYLEEDKINVTYSVWKPKKYNQYHIKNNIEFTPYSSILDILFNVPLDDIEQYMK